ncbi:glycosyltransferase family A protein [Pseudodesulfovibrio pelocollis]|uniref:glycosyltransferase family A protein n=1 Tax=Pseudodesulfovibrio pelocollis TaxID=3051432 RepID=UPI00255AA4E5|nr:glycosyltransferase family A protein [Pseudodesulfovibrio sp. SB368]
MKTVVMGTVFKGVEPYLEAYFRSLLEQRDREFGVLIVNDGLDQAEVTRWTGDLDVSFVSNSGTPGVNRMAGIRRCLESRVEVIVFADCDDVQGMGRVAESRKLIGAGAAIVCNDVIPMTADGVVGNPWFSHVFDHGQAVTKEDIRCGNCLGLGNTAVAAAILAVELTIPADIPAFDWALYGALLESGREAVFTAEAATFYRQHEMSFAGHGLLGADYLLRCLAVKEAHYRFMNNHFTGYAALAQAYGNLHARCTEDRRHLMQLADALDAKKSRKMLWWECC